MAAQQPPPIGMFVHTFAACDVCASPRIEYQGRVLGRLSEDVLLVQLFSWLTGLATVAKQFSTDQITKGGWLFYSDDESWKRAGDQWSSPEQHHRCKEFFIDAVNECLSDPKGFVESVNTGLWP